MQTPDRLKERPHRRVWHLTGFRSSDRLWTTSSPLKPPAASSRCFRHSVLTRTRPRGPDPDRSITCAPGLRHLSPYVMHLLLIIRPKVCAICIRSIKTLCIEPSARRITGPRALG